MYYEIMSKPIIKTNKREYIIQHKEEILKIVEEMLKPDAPTNYTNYSIYKDCFISFSHEILEKYKVLNSPKIEYIIDDGEIMDKHILLQPKTKTSIIECMKKYNDSI